MAKALIILALFVLATTAFVAQAFVLRPTALNVIGSAKKGHHLWKPQRAISLTPSIIAVRVSLSADDCNDRVSGSCKYGIAFSTDAGETFHVDDRAEVADFCGSGGVKNVDKTGAASIDCIDTATISQDKNTKALVYKVKTFGFSPNSNVVEVFGSADEDAPTVMFAQPAAASELPHVASLHFGDTIANFDDKGILGRNIEATLTNSSVIHAFYKSTDGGAAWEYVSHLPFPMGSESALHVTGATKVMLIAGESNAFKQAVSVFLGSRWEKIENVTYSSPLSTYSSTLGTTVYGGLRGRPGLIGMAAGRKRGSEKLVDFANLHNKMVSRLIAENNNDVKAVGSFKGLSNVGNFSNDFMNATAFECRAGGSVSDDNGCASSSYTSVLPLGNGSTVVAFYDKLLNGYNPSNSDGDHTLYAMKLSLNETKEQKEVDDKIKEEQAAEEKRKAGEERRKQQQREQEKKEREKKRAKTRADKKKKKDFAKMDRANIIAARLSREKDDDIIIVRDVNVDFMEQERDTFFDAFAPNADEIEAREAAEEEKKEAERAAKKAAAKKKAAAAAEGEAAKEDEAAGANEESNKDDAEDKE